jgi:hypothetical protein
LPKTWKRSRDDIGFIPLPRIAIIGISDSKGKFPLAARAIFCKSSLQSFA